MKRIIFTTLLVFFSFVKGTSQINNLKDLLEISELNVEETVSELQYTWKLNPPIQDTSEKGFVTERHTFSFNLDNKKQVLKKCGRMNLETSQTMWLTNFVSNDKDLLSRITKNLTYQGFELKGKLKSNSMYEDGNRIVSIQTESDNDYKLPIGFYSINVIVNKKINGGYVIKNKENLEIQETKKSNPLNNISNYKSKEISLVKNISELIRISKTASSEINSVLSNDWKKLEYPKNEEPLNEWYSIVNNNQYLESYIGRDNGIGKDIRIVTFEFSDKILLDKVIEELKKTNFKLEEKNENYLSYENKGDVIVIYLSNKLSSKGSFKIELSVLPIEIDKIKSENNIGTGSGTRNNFGNGYNLNGRKAIVKPLPEYKCNEQGKVTVQIVVDKSGNVLEAKTGVKGTTNMSKCLLDASKEASLKTKWQSDENAPERQIGTIYYNFSLN